VDASREGTTRYPYLKRNRGLLIVGMLFFLLGVLWDIHWISERLTPLPWVYLIPLLPGALLLLTWYLASRHYRRRWPIMAGALIPVVMSLLLAAFLGIGASMEIEQRPITDVARYHEFYERERSSGVSSHFPNQIPSDAEDAWLFYQPAVWQGGMEARLGLQLPEQRVSELWENYKSTAIGHRMGADNACCNRIGPETEFGACTRVPPPYATGEEPVDLPGSCDIFILGRDGHQGHGEGWGVAIDRSVAKVVYWAFWY
jgi:hypothetical protein